MLYYIDYQPQLSLIWETQMLQSSQEKKYHLFQVSSDVILQSWKRALTVYQQSFALFYRDNFYSVVSTISDRNILNNIQVIINYWFEMKIYALDFYSHLICLIERRLFILDQPDNKYLIDENAKEIVEIIDKLDIAKRIIELDIGEERLQEIFDFVSFSQLNNMIEEYKQKPKSKKRIQQLTVIEEELHLFKEMLLINLSKRENVIMNISDNMEKEKLRYGLDDDVDIDIGMNIDSNSNDDMQIERSNIPLC